MKRTFLFILYLFGGVLTGSLLAEIGKKVSWLSWLTWGQTIGIDNVSVDFAVVRFQFGLQLSMNIAVLICLIIAMVLYVKTSGKIH